VIEIDVTGEEEVQAALRAVVGKLQGHQMEAALLAGALPIMNAAKTNAPKLTGTLARSIHVLERSPRQVVIGTDLVYARIQEEGGDIAPVNATYLRFEVGGDVIYTRGPVHIPAQPYMRPAFESERSAAMREIAGAVRDLVASSGR